MRWRILFKDGVEQIIDSAEDPRARDERWAICLAIDQRRRDGATWPQPVEAVEIQQKGWEE